VKKATFYRELFSYFWIVVGSTLYGIGTVLFIFPHKLLLGGTSGISVILEKLLPFSPGAILMVINFTLLIIAFFTLGKEMAIKTIVGSSLTTLSIGILESLWGNAPLIPSLYLSCVIGAVILAVASGIMFYVGSNGGGTDIIALIVKKYTRITDIGKALLVTDVLIVIVGGIVSGFHIGIGSFLGLLIKTLGIDGVIFLVRHYRKNVGD
jgi:uncharacterized membrane-anchored protein YitT (DUF2179 family)